MKALQLEKSCGAFAFWVSLGEKLASVITPVIHIGYVRWPIVLALVSSACAASTSKPILPDDLRACRVPACERTTPIERAVCCAQKFVRTNVYTSEGVIGPIAYESLEFQADDSAIVASRKGTLNPAAVAACNIVGGYIVVFEYNGGSSWGRAVTMRDDFTEMRVQHQFVDWWSFYNEDPKKGCWRQVDRTRP